MRTLATAMLVLLLLLAPVPRPLAEEADERPGPTTFEGMQRGAVAVLLGPPHKVKRARGQETLIYKLKRVDDNYLPAANERLLVLPEHGPCIAALPKDGALDSVSIEPPRTDRSGRPISSGVSTTISKTIDLSEGERFDLPPDSGGKVLGKLKLKLILDGDRVASWSATR